MLRAAPRRAPGPTAASGGPERHGLRDHRRQPGRVFSGRSGLTLQLTGDQRAARSGASRCRWRSRGFVAPTRCCDWPAFAYIFYFRGTPLLVQMFLIYYGIGQFVPQSGRRASGTSASSEAYFCAVLTLTLNTAAYTAEILRGAIEALPSARSRRRRACGMSRPADAAPDHPAQAPSGGAPGLHQRGHLHCSRRPRWRRSSRSWI